jgi:hypothetical protein
LRRPLCGTRIVLLSVCARSLLLLSIRPGIRSVVRDPCALRRHWLLCDVVPVAILWEERGLRKIVLRADHL